MASITRNSDQASSVLMSIRHAISHFGDESLRQSDALLLIFKIIIINKEHTQKTENEQTGHN